MAEIDILEEALEEVAGGKRVPYLGPEVAALSGGSAPTDPAKLCALIEAQVRAPRRASGNLWSVAQFVESRKFRKTLDVMVEKAFAPEETGSGAGPNPIHDWLANVRPPMIVDAWYDDGILRALGDGDWGGWVQGVSRNGEWIEIWTRAYAPDGTLVEESNPDWKTLVYKPHGLARAGSSYLMSDSDYVEVLTEIDIQTPIPEEVRRRRVGRPFLFLGCRFDDQMLRIFARQIAKRSAEGHVAVFEGEPTRMERKFFEELGVKVLNLPLSSVTDLLSEPVG